MRASCIERWRRRSRTGPASGIGCTACLATMGVRLSLTKGFEGAAGVGAPMGRHASAARPADPRAGAMGAAGAAHAANPRAGESPPRPARDADGCRDDADPASSSIAGRGHPSAWVWGRELFGWRPFRNGREVGAFRLGAAAVAQWRASRETRASAAWGSRSYAPWPWSWRGAGCAINRPVRLRAGAAVCGRRRAPAARRDRRGRPARPHCVVAVCRDRPPPLEAASLKPVAGCLEPPGSSLHASEPPSL